MPGRMTAFDRGIKRGAKRRHSVLEHGIRTPGITTSPHQGIERLVGETRGQKETRAARPGCSSRASGRCNEGGGRGPAYPARGQWQTPTAGGRLRALDSGSGPEVTAGRGAQSHSHRSHYLESSSCIFRKRAMSEMMNWRLFFVTMLSRSSAFNSRLTASR